MFFLEQKCGRIIFFEKSEIKYCYVRYEFGRFTNVGTIVQKGMRNPFWIIFNRFGVFLFNFI